MEETTRRKYTIFIIPFIVTLYIIHTFLKAKLRNLKVEAEILFTLNTERVDLMQTKLAMPGVSFSKGLFARKSIPRETVLAYYPGDRISNEESDKRSKERPEGDRYVFLYQSGGKIVR